MATFKKAVETRNAALDAEWTELGANPDLLTYSGTVPAAVTDAPGGGTTLLSTIALGVTPMAAASGGVKAKATTWTDPSPALSGAPSFFRIRKTAGGAVRYQGTVGIAGSGPGGTNPDIVITVGSITAGVPYTVATYQTTAGNA